jgi:hypothetical protein
LSLPGRGHVAALPNLKRGVFRCLAELEIAIDRLIAETKITPIPHSSYVARPNRILAAVKRGTEKLESLH